MNKNIIALSAAIQKKAHKLMKELDIVNIWHSVGADVNIVGSLRLGLMKNLDIDLHVYSAPLTVESSFAAISKLAQNPAVYNITYTNLIDTSEKCIEWHVLLKDSDGAQWKMDMIHILKGSFYDGYFERVADRISAVLTQESKNAILQLKHETPQDIRIAGIEYYRAVIAGGVRTYKGFEDWRKENPLTGVLEWMP